MLLPVGLLISSNAKFIIAVADRGTFRSPKPPPAWGLLRKSKSPKRKRKQIQKKRVAKRKNESDNEDYLPLVKRNANFFILACLTASGVSCSGISTAIQLV